MESELLEATEEMRELTVERRKAEVEGPKGLNTAGAGVGREAVSGAQKL